MNIFVGILLIIAGFLVKKFPMLIAGYNTMPEEKKKNVDIEGLSTFMRNGLIIIGLLVILFHFISASLGLDAATVNTGLMVIILVGTLILVYKAQQFDHN